MRIFSKTYRIAVFAAAIGFVYAPSCIEAQQPPSAYAVTHAKVITLAGANIDDGTIVIKDGKISAVGANVEVPAGAQIIDGKGLQVYPGLFDAIATGRATLQLVPAAAPPPSVRNSPVPPGG